MLSTIFLIVALILLILCAFGVNHPRVNLGWLGLAFWVAALLVPVVLR